MTGFTTASADDGGTAPSVGQVTERPSETEGRPLVVFRGNLLFSEYVYRALLGLPPTARADPETARAVAAKLRAFLFLAGYELAHVEPHISGDQIVVDVDEGQLDKVVVFGSGIVETLRFKLELFLPGNVFDRRALEQQLADLAHRYHVNPYHYELVPVEATESRGPQLETLEPVLRLPAVRPGQRYELHIFNTSDPWSRGLSPEISLDPIEGLSIGGWYRSHDLLFSSDRWEGLSRVAGAVRPYLDRAGSQPVFTRALAEARWQAPPLLHEIRPAVVLLADVLSVQRADLGLENVDQATFAASVDLGFTLPQLAVTGAVGAQRRFHFALEQDPGASAFVDTTPTAQTRLYAEVRVEALFNPRELRVDRRHELEVEAREYVATPSSGEALWLRGRYQHRIAFGWHELWLRARATSLLGAVSFLDEESVGRYLHGPFSTSVFARSVLGVGLEYRFSLVRDAVKLGVFYDQVAYGAIDRSGGPTLPATAGTLGPSAYLLLADEFELGGCLAFGWRPPGLTDFAPTLTLRQVF